MRKAINFMDEINFVGLSIPNDEKHGNLADRLLRFSCQENIKTKMF